MINNFNYTFKKGDKIGIVGENGSGKTTLLNVLARIKQPLYGELDYGSTIEIGYFRQNSDDLDDEKRVIDYIKEKAEFIDLGNGLVSASTMLENFLFDANQQYSYIKKLSGGEKRRLMLLGILMKNPNLLILDEPTNDLDITTLTILEDYLINFKGVIIVVSHDRFFMDRVVESLWIIDNKEISFSFDSYTSFLSIEKVDKKVTQPKVDRYVKEKRVRFTYQEQKDFETIDDEIKEIEEEINKLNEEMNECMNDFEKITVLDNKRQELESLLQAKNDRWLELYEKKELIDSNL